MARRTSFLVLVLALAAAPTLLPAEPLPLPAMHWADTSRGRPFSKDPAVVRFRDRTLRYYSVPPAAAKSPGESWAAG